jgi:hypothetical protein
MEGGSHEGGEGDEMKWEDEGTSIQPAHRERAAMRNVRHIDQQRVRLFIYRVGVARARAAVEEGAPPIQSAWRAANEMTGAFTLDRRDSGVLVGCLVVAVREK